MKKKFLIGGAALLFAAVTALNMNLLQGNSAGDVSLDAVAVMAQAQEEFVLKGQEAQKYLDEMKKAYKEWKDNAQGMTSTSGNPCYATTTSVTVGGSHTVSYGTSNTTSFTVSFSGPEIGLSSKVQKGEALTFDWSATTNQILLGYEVLCYLSHSKGTCTPRSCDEVKMNY